MTFQIFLASIAVCLQAKIVCCFSHSAEVIRFLALYFGEGLFILPFALQTHTHTDTGVDPGVEQICDTESQWRTQEFCLGGGSTNSVEDREKGDLGAVAP